MIGVATTLAALLVALLGFLLVRRTRRRRAAAAASAPPPAGCKDGTVEPGHHDDENGVGGMPAADADVAPPQAEEPQEVHGETRRVPTPELAGRSITPEMPEAAGSWYARDVEQKIRTRDFVSRWATRGEASRG